MTRAQALLAYAYLCTTESDSIMYEIPRPVGERADYAMQLLAESRRAGEDADMMSTDYERYGDWHRVMAWFGGEPI